MTKSEETTTVRRISAGMTRMNIRCELKLRGYKTAGGPGVGSLRMTLPKALLELMKWKGGTRCRLQVKGRGLMVSECQKAGIYGPRVPLKQSMPPRIQLQRHWQDILRRMCKYPAARRCVRKKGSS